MQELTGTFSKLRNSKILVVGDLILDSYTIGKARRISPEAPVAVLEVQKEEHRAGGAGNVALNLISLAADVTLVGRLGDDTAGDLLKASLANEGISVQGLFTEKTYRTPVKNRVIADHQQIIRVDHEKISTIDLAFEAEILQKLPDLVKGHDVIAISDYGKGFLSNKLLETLINLGNQLNIPIVVDPKGIDFKKYKGATLIKPNLSEAYLAANMSLSQPIDQVAKALLETTSAKVLMMTRSESGISLFHQEGLREDFPVQIKEVKDVTGAGDTVLAMLSVSLACGLSYTEAARFCNLAAGIAIERFGCARVSLSDLARRLLEFDFINKVFDEGHLFALQEALKGRKIRLLGISGENGLTSAIFMAIQKLSESLDDELIVYLRDKEPNHEFVHILSSFQNVKFIILNTDSLSHLVSEMEPSEVYLLENEELLRLDHPHELMK